MVVFSSEGPKCKRLRRIPLLPGVRNYNETGSWGWPYTFYKIVRPSHHVCSTVEGNNEQGVEGKYETVFLQDRPWKEVQTSRVDPSPQPCSSCVVSRPLLFFRSVTWTPLKESVGVGETLKERPIGKRSQELVHDPTTGEREKIGRSIRRENLVMT